MAISFHTCGLASIWHPFLSLRNKETETRRGSMAWLISHSIRFYFWLLMFFFNSPTPFRVALHGGGGTNRTCIPSSYWLGHLQQRLTLHLFQCFPYPHNGKRMSAVPPTVLKMGRGVLRGDCSRTWKWKLTLNTSGWHSLTSILFFCVNWKLLKVTFLS